MSFLDMRTVVFSSVIINIICTLLVVSLWQQSRIRFAGTFFWVLDFAFQTTGLILIILRGLIPDWASMVLSNTLIVTGALLGYIGLQMFLGKKGTQVHNYILVAIFIGIHSYFALVKPDLAARNLNIAAGLFIMCFQCAWLLLIAVPKGQRSLTLGAGLVFIGYCLLSGVRIIENIAVPPYSNDFFSSGTADILVMVAFQVLLILLTYSFALMVNQRLNVDIHLEQEKFSKAFQSSPYAITLTRFPDGTIFEVNDGFTNITGFSRAEVIGKTTVELQLWAEEAARNAVVNELQEKKKVYHRECTFRKKSGQLLTGLFSADVIRIHDSLCILSSINDITLYKQSEQQIQQSNALYRTLVETSPDAIGLLDMQGNILMTNRQALELFGFDICEDLTGRPLMSLVTDEHSEYVNEKLTKLLASGDLRNVVLPIFKKTGEAIYIEISSSLLRNDAGQPESVMVVFRDVTRRREDEKALQESEEKYRQLFENANEGIGVVQDGAFKLVNHKLLEIMGLDMKDLLAQPFADLIHPDDRKLVTDRHYRRLKGESFESVYEFRAINRAGHIIWIEISAVRIEWEGRPATLNFFSDVSLRKRAEMEMANTNSFLNSLIDQSPTPMWISDENGTLVRINEACCKLLNITQKDVLGKYNVLQDNIVEKQGFLPLIRDVFEKGSIARFNLHYNTTELRQLDLANSASVVLEVTIFPVTDARGRITNAVIQHKDITLQEQAETKLAESYQKLRSTFNDAINTMVKIAEMRDPYTAGHQQKVARLATAIARELQLDDERVEQIRMAAVIHDIGKMYVSSDILSKPGRLTPIEMNLIRTHAQGSYDIIKSMDFPCIIATSVLQHHERLDGSGYPNSVSGEEISLEARVLAVADVVEAMASHRPYRPALGIDRALEEISANSGKLYDPRVVEACLRLFREKGFHWDG